MIADDAKRKGQTKRASKELGPQFPIKNLREVQRLAESHLRGGRRNEGSRREGNEVCNTIHEEDGGLKKEAVDPKS